MLLDIKKKKELIEIKMWKLSGKFNLVSHTFTPYYRKPLVKSQELCYSSSDCFINYLNEVEKSI